MTSYWPFTLISKHLPLASSNKTNKLKARKYEQDMETKEKE